MKYKNSRINGRVATNYFLQGNYNKKKLSEQKSRKGLNYSKLMNRLFCRK